LYSSDNSYTSSFEIDSTSLIRKRDGEMNNQETKTAYVFPGQGAQELGMGMDLYENFSSAREAFDEADDALGFAISRLCFEGPLETLTKTDNVQPALLVTSIACLRAAEQSDMLLPSASFAGGPSLAEYTAIAAAGMVSLGDAVRIVRERGRLMDEAGKKRPGGLLAVIGLDKNIVDDICASTETVISNINAPGQIIISGTNGAIEKAYKLAEETNAYRLIRLKVSGAFHSPLMEPVVDEMREVISRYKFKPPAFPVIGMAARMGLTDVEEIKKDLVSQIISCNDWISCVEHMKENGIDSYIEFGPGQVISRLISRIDSNARIFNISGIEDIINSQDQTSALSPGNEI